MSLENSEGRIEFAWTVCVLYEQNKCIYTHNTCIDEVVEVLCVLYSPCAGAVP